MKILQRVVPLFGRASERRYEALIEEDLAGLEVSVREAIENSAAVRCRLQSIHRRGCSVYVVLELLAGLYPSSPDTPEATPASPVLYRVSFYGEADSDGDLALVPTRTRTLQHGGVAREFAERRMGLTRYLARACDFCGHRAITLWRRFQARYDRKPRHCPACQRPYTLDVEAVRRFTNPPAVATMLAGCWLSGHMHSLLPLAFGLLVLVAVEATVIITAPQRHR